MYLLQTKKASLDTGGPQYFLHGHTEAVREFLRTKGTRPVILQTPYGIVETPFVAVGKDHKLDRNWRVVPGRVGKDRIQQGKNATESIGEAIRRWYSLRAADFDRIDIDIELHPDGHFIVWPTAISWQERKNPQYLTMPSYHPLSFHSDEQSRLWRDQIAAALNREPDQAEWIKEQVCRVVDDHVRIGESHLSEADLLRTAGALSKLGMRMGPSRGKGFDCIDSEFIFDGYPGYPCPIELKKRSRDFRYQEINYLTIPRVVVLCMKHNLRNLRPHVDVVELASLSDYLMKQVA